MLIKTFLPKGYAPEQQPSDFYIMLAHNGKMTKHIPKVIQTEETINLQYTFKKTGLMMFTFL